MARPQAGVPKSEYPASSRVFSAYFFGCVGGGRLAIGLYLLAPPVPVWWQEDSFFFQLAYLKAPILPHRMMEPEELTEVQTGTRCRTCYSPLVVGLSIYYEPDIWWTDGAHCMLMNLWLTTSLIVSHRAGGCGSATVFHRARSTPASSLRDDWLRRLVAPQANAKIIYLLRGVGHSAR